MPPPERKDKDAEHPNFTATEEIEKILINSNL
jgi:hypothetical protein